MERAVWQRQGRCSAILHYDSSSHLQIGDYLRFLKQNTLLCSMSAVSHCCDNAACKGFFGMQSARESSGIRNQCLNSAKADVFDYIERHYNLQTRRRVAKGDLQFRARHQPYVKAGVNCLY